MAYKGWLNQKLVQDIAWSALARAAGMAVTFVSGFALARMLGPSDYGIYSMLMAVPLIVSAFVQLGFPQLATRDISRLLASDQAERIRALLFWFSIVIAGGCAVALLMLLGLYSVSKLPLMSIQPKDAALAAFLIPLTAFNNLIVGVLRGLHRNIVAQLQYAVIRPILFTGLLISSSVFASSWITAMVAVSFQAFAAVAAVAIGAVSIKRALPASDHHAKVPRTLHKWIRSALPMGGTDIVRMIEAQIPFLLIAAFLSTKDVGLYRVAVSASALIGLPTSLVVMTIASRLSTFFIKGDISSMERLLAAAALTTTISAAIATVVLIVFGEHLLRIAFGKVYAESWPTLILLCISYCVSSTCAGAMTTLNMCGLERKLFSTYLVGMGVTLTIAIILVQYIGIVGVAIGALFGEVIRCFIMRYLAKRRLGIETSLVGARAYLASCFDCSVSS